MKTKEEVRVEAKRIRDGIPDREQRSIEICENLVVSDLFQEANSIMFYSAINSEVDLSHALEKAFELNKTILFPVVDGENLLPCVVDRNTEWVEGAFGILEPKERIVFEGDIDLVLVPGLAFDKKGNRVGYGKGYYDRFLKQNNAVTMGVCFTEQLVEPLPVEDNDEDLTLTFTD